MSSDTDSTWMRIQLQHKMIAYGAWISCLNCHHWQQNIAPESPMRCIKFDATPPINVIVSGCRAWLPRLPF